MTESVTTDETTSGTHRRMVVATQATCPVCQAQFAPKKPWQRFDKSACRRAFHKAAGGGEMAKRLLDLERRMAEVEAAVWPLGK